MENKESTFEAVSDDEWAIQVSRSGFGLKHLRQIKPNLSVFYDGSFGIKKAFFDVPNTTKYIFEGSSSDISLLIQKAEELTTEEFLALMLTTPYLFLEKISKS